MNSILTIQERNAVLLSMAKLIQQEREAILKANKKDVENYSGEDIAMYDRLKVDDSKIKGMIDSLKQLASFPASTTYINSRDFSGFPILPLFNFNH